MPDATGPYRAPAQHVVDDGTTLTLAEATVADALIWCGGAGARYAYPRFPEAYARRARVIVAALRDAGLLADAATSVKPGSEGSDA